MERRHNHDDTKQDFEQALKELVIVLAEICAHEFLQNIDERNNEDD